MNLELENYTHNKTGLPSRSISSKSRLVQITPFVFANWEITKPSITRLKAVLILRYKSIVVIFCKLKHR